MEALQLVEDFLVYQIVPRDPRETVQRPADHAEAGMAHLACRPNQDHGFADAPSLHPAAGTHLQHLSIQRFKANLLGKVLAAAVGKISRDQHLVAAVLEHHRLFGKYLQPLDNRVRPGGPAIGSTGSNPAQDRPVVRGSLFKPHSAAMGLPHSRFQQEEAVLG